MKRVISILFLFIILLGSFKDAAIFISFKINQNYIAKNLCIERDIPDSECHGCCQLKEKLKESHQQEQNMPEKPEQKSGSTILLFFLPLQKSNEGILDSKLRPVSGALKLAYNFHYSSDCFHPPKLL